MGENEKNQNKMRYEKIIMNRKYFVYAVRRIYGILYKITFAFDGLYF